MPRGFITFDGPSAINGAPIIAVLTLKSANEKTGNIPQLWILDATTPPQDAARSGLDVSVCGGCKHGPGAPAGKRSCYVTLHHGPRSVFDGYQRGIYTDATTDAGWAALAAWMGRNVPRAIRLGAYGDPAAVPAYALQALVSLARANDATALGYTHDWRHPRAAHLKDTCMASVDNPTEATRARANGWRTFRVRTPDETNAPGEVTCPATTPTATTCKACRACDGLASSDRPNVSVAVHGTGSKHYTAARMTR